MIKATYQEYADSCRHPTGKLWYFSATGVERGGRELHSCDVRESVYRE